MVYSDSVAVKFHVSRSKLPTAIILDLSLRFKKIRMLEYYAKKLVSIAIIYNIYNFKNLPIKK